MCEWVIKEAMGSTGRSSLRVASIALSRATAPVEVREQLALQDWVGQLAGWSASVREWAIVTTCHRFELYVVTESDTLEALCNHLKAMLSTIVATVANYEFAEGNDPWIVRTDQDVADHLCDVAAGIDSLVLGEAQIQGQVISTYTKGLEDGTIGPLLSSLFRTAIRVGKRARTETHISTRAVSMSSVALSMAARYFPDFAQVRVLVIGAGEMSRLALKALHQRQVSNVTIANRTLARAEAALMRRSWRAIELAQVPAILGEFDVVFSATSATDLIVTREQLLHAREILKTPLAEAHNQVLIDLAVPRDIDPAIRELPGFVLVDVDDLRQGLDQSLENRKQALPAVNAIIDEEIERWHAEQRELSMRPYVVELRQRAERIRQQEVERTMRFLGPVDSETQQHIQHLSRALVNKILHEPTVRIKELAHNDEADLYVSALCDIFGLESSNPIVSNLENAELSGEPSRS